MFLEESSWSGWVRDYKPEIKKSEYELKKDIKNVVKTSHGLYTGENGEVVEEDRERFAFTITEIGSDFIIIETSCPMSERYDGKINMLSDETTFKIEKNKKTELTTPTMDAGETYIFELKD